MSTKLHDDGLGGKGLTVASFAFHVGISISRIRTLCSKGLILGARRHPTTKQWWIYPPAKLLVGT